MPLLKYLFLLKASLLIIFGCQRSGAGLNSVDVGEEGFLRPTIYYHVVIDEDKLTCSKTSELLAAGGKPLIKLCDSTKKSCRIQGSCTVRQNKINRKFNIATVKQGYETFFETTNDICQFGYGSQSICLDPFYSVAADLSHYKTGDVIFIPSVKGLELPDQTKHSGYFIVRDRGTKIIGKGRFDFYTGYLSPNEKSNPFAKIGFGDVRTAVPYYLITGSVAEKFLAERAFPKIPQ